MIDELNFKSSVTHVEKSPARLNLSPPLNKRRIIHRQPTLQL